MIWLKIEKYSEAFEGCLFIPKIIVVAQFPPVSLMNQSYRLENFLNSSIVRSTILGSLLKNPGFMAWKQA
jgi:hypothetical protein